MLRVTFVGLALVLAGTANAGWRDLAIDGSSETNFVDSVAVLKRKLTKMRAVELELALNDIWVQNQLNVFAYTPADYFRALDGLGFKEVLALSDPTGDEAAGRRAIARR